MKATDITGLGVSTTSNDALAAYERGLDLFLRWRGGAVEALDAATQADPRFVLAHCAKAYITWRMGRADLAIAAARQAAAVADDARHERERLHVRAVDAMQRGDHKGSYDVLGQIAAHHPTDRIAVRIVGLNCITQGDYRGGIDIARRSLEASPDEPQYLTMLGFFLEQSGYNDEGLAMSLASLARDPTSLYTYHAVPATTRYPLSLISPASEHTISSTLGELRPGVARLKMHPDDAHPRSITDGCSVRVFNDLGDVHCEASITPEICAGTVSLPKGLWARSTFNGATANALVPDTLSDIGGGACFNDARVEVQLLARH
jgi:tetratricopeptide (TPR) repeat protein